jgi:hypothetical protein
VPGVAFDVLRPEPEVRHDAVGFVQTVGCRAGSPASRRVRGKPFFRIHSATAWTTLALTIRADGSSFHELVGASPFQSAPIGPTSKRALRAESQCAVAVTGGTMTVTVARYFEWKRWTWRYRSRRSTTGARSSHGRFS